MNEGLNEARKGLDIHDITDLQKYVGYHLNNPSSLDHAKSGHFGVTEALTNLFLNSGSIFSINEDPRHYYGLVSIRYKIKIRSEICFNIEVPRALYLAGVLKFFGSNRDLVTEILDEVLDAGGNNLWHAVNALSGNQVDKKILEEVNDSNGIEPKYLQTNQRLSGSFLNRGRFNQAYSLYKKLNASNGDSELSRLFWFGQDQLPITRSQLTLVVPSIGDTLALSSEEDLDIDLTQREYARPDMSRIITAYLTIHDLVLPRNTVCWNDSEEILPRELFIRS